MPAPDAMMLFAAGFGTRMGALTQTRPKPLVPVAGRPLIDHALDLAEGARIGRIVANTHYLGAQVAAHLAGRRVAISDESARILETGGGLRRALPHLGPGPVFTLNSDAVWTGPNPLVELAGGWRPGIEALLLLLPDPRGDFLMDAEGRLSRAGGRPGYRFLGAQILRTGRLATVADAKFSLNLVWDAMIADGGLFGMVHRGGWCDVGTPEGILRAEEMLRG